MRTITPSNSTGLRILLIESNPVDVHQLRDALQEIAGSASLWALRDGETAVDWLDHCGDSEWLSLRPDLILLGLNLPGLSGNELLLTIKSHARTRSVPVIVMSGSSSPEDVRHAYDSHANCFVPKPRSPDGFVAAVKSIEAFWTGTAILPRSGMHAGLKKIGPARDDGRECTGPGHIHPAVP